MNEKPRFLESLTTLLTRPESAGDGEASPAEPAAVGTAVCIALGWSAYGAAAGFYQGGPGVVLAAVKIPLILFASIALCLPSLYVFTALAGEPLPPPRLRRICVVLAGRLALLAIGLVPIVWLFAASTRLLGFAALTHVGIWALSLIIVRRAVLVPELNADQRRRGGMWLLLLFVVALQVATALRPVLLRPAGEPWLTAEKRFFIGHFVRSAAREYPGSVTSSRRAP